MGRLLSRLEAKVAALRRPGPDPRLGRYVGRPGDYARDVLRRTPTPQQERIWALAETPPYRVLVPSANNQGKCVHPDDRIPLALGPMAPARELAGTTFGLLTLDPAGRPVMTAAFAEWDEPQPMVAVTLATGELIRRTANHPVWSTRGLFPASWEPVVPPGGWVEAGKLKAGDLVAVPDVRPHEGADTLSDAELCLVAYMAGGGYTKKRPATFTSKAGPVLDEFRRYAAEMGTVLVPTERPDTYRVSRADGIRRNGACGVLDLLRRLGMYRNWSWDGHLPPAVMGAGGRGQRLFLSRLFATRGWVSPSGEVWFRAETEPLCRDVQELLSRQGIRSVLTPWELTVPAGPDVVRFADAVGIFGAEAEVERARYLSAVDRRPDWVTLNAPPGCRWEKIESVEPLPAQQSVAITVPNRHTFVTCVYEHNTFAGACYASYFYDCYRPSTTLITAPVYKQVRDLMFKELRTLRPGDPGFLPKDTRLQDAHDHFAHGFTANTPDAFQGRHAEHLCLIFDEATGIARAFADRGRTMAQPHPGHAWLCFYNPNDPASWVYAEEESDTWHVVRLSALEHPNILAELAGGPPPIPAAIRLAGLVARLLAECEPVDDPDPLTDFRFPPDGTDVRRARDRWLAYGLSDAAVACLSRPGQWWRPKVPAFEAQVLGRWPLTPTATLFTPALIDRCANRPVCPLQPDWPVAIGCDVARFGDDKTAFGVRCGPVLLHVETHAKRDTSWIADRAVELDAIWADRLSRPRGKATFIVDGTGGYGGGVVDQAQGRLTTIELLMSAASPDPKVARMRSYLYFRLAALAVAGILDFSRLPSADLATLKRQLTVTPYEDDGVKRLLPKARVKELLGCSPDVADAVALTYYG
jgi:hypothetical protein